MFKFLISKKGFTLVELAICVLVLGILTAIAIPVFSISLKSKKIEDCKSNRIIIESTIEEVMLGYMDNGRPQRLYDDGNYSDDLNDKYSDNDVNPLTMFFWKPLTSLTTVEYKGETVKCFKLTNDEENLIFTISDIRGGWNGKYDPEEIVDCTEVRDSDDYINGCLTVYDDKDSTERVIIQENRFYLKKRELAKTPFYTYLDLSMYRGDVPKCPFSTKNNTYFYYILEDGSVICSCPHCQ